MLTRVIIFSVATGLWAIVGSSETTGSSSNTTSAQFTSRSLTKEFRARYEASVTTLLDSLKRSHGEQQTTRSRSAGRGRRDVRMRKQTRDDRGVYRLTSVEPLFPLCSYNKHVSWTRMKNATYAVCISKENTASLGRLETSGWSVLDEWSVTKAQQSVVFSYNEVLYAVVADEAKADGTDLLRFNSDTAKMDIDHTVHSRYATAVTLWKMYDNDDTYHLAIANSHGPGSKAYLDFTYTYEWRETYFDHYDSLSTYDVRDLEAFHVYGHAYLVVANHRTDKGSYDVDSEIFRFDAEMWRWKSFQKISTQAVSDVHFFRIGPDYAPDFFLVFANQFEIKSDLVDYAVDSVVYKLIGDRFVPFQCIQTHGATGVSSHYDPLSGAFIMAVSNAHSPVQLFQYDGWTFVQSSVQSTAESMSPGATSLVFHPWNGMTANHRHQLALVVSNPRKEAEDSVFALSFVKERPFLQWFAESLDWCSQADDRINITRTADMVKTLKNAYFLDRNEPLFLNKDVNFQGGLSIKKEVQAPKMVDLHETRVLDFSLLFQLQSLEQRLHSVKSRTQHLKSLLSNSVKTSGHQTITGHLDFESLSASCNEADCDIKSIDAKFLNDKNVENLHSRVLLLDQPNTILGSLNFKELHVQGDIVITGLVDGVNVSQVVTKHSKGKVLSETTFAHTVVASEINVQGTVDGFRIDPSSIMLTEGDQEVFGEVTFTEVELQDIEVEGKVSGVNLREFYEDVVFVGGGVQTVTGPKLLKGPVTFRDLHLDTGRINGVDLVDLWNNVVWLDTAQNIQGLWNQSNLNLVNPSVSTVNGLQIPGPEVVIVGPGDLLIPGKQVFLGDLVVGSLEVDESLNGLQRIQNKDNECHNQLDLVLRSCDQTIHGAKTFLSTVLKGRNTVSGKLNNYDLKKLEDHLNHRVLNITEHWVLNQVEIRAPVLVKESLVGWEVEQLYHRALKLEQPLPENARVSFKNLVKIERLQCNDLNGVDVEKNLLLRHGSAVLTASKNWEQMLLLENAKVLGKINGFDLNFLADVLRNGPHLQVLHAHRVVEGDLIVDNLVLEGKLSGVDLSKAIRLDRDLTFSVPVNLENTVVVGDLLAGSVIVSSGIVNEQNFIEMLNDTMIYSLPQRVFGKKTVTGSLTVPSGSNLDVDLVNGIDLKSLQRDTVYQDQAQVVAGRKTFLKPVRFHNLVMNGSINGVLVWDIFNNWLLQNAAQTITADVTFAGGLKVDGDVSVTGLVNGIDVEALQRDVIPKTQHFTIVGGLRLKHVRVQGDVLVSGRVDGVDLSEEAVRMFSDNVIAGEKSFKNVLVDGDLVVEGHVNDIRVSDLCRFTARRGQPLVLDEVVVRGNLEILGHLRTNGSINDLILEQFKHSVVLLNESHHFSNVVFDEVFFEQPVDLRGRLNGLDLKNLGENYMSLSRNQDVYSKAVFKGPVTIEGKVHADHMTTADCVIGTVNIVHTSQNVLTTHREQTIGAKIVVKGNLHLLHDLYVPSSVNGLRLPSDVGLKSRPNVVTGPLVFSDDLVVSTDLDLSVGATVQGVDVSEWASNTVMVTGQFTLTGVKKFRDLNVLNLRALDVFGGITVSESTILLKNRKQVVKGKVSFGGTVHVKGSLNTSSEINGVMVPKLLTESVLKNRPAVITGHKIFYHPLTIKKLFTTGFVSSVNLTELSLLIKRPYDLEVLQSNLANNFQSLALFTTFLSETPHRLNYYEDWFRWEESVTAWTHLSLSDNKQLLFVSRKAKHSSDCSRLHVYTIGNEGPVETVVLPMSDIIALDTIVFESTIFLAVSNVDSLCVLESGGVDIFSLNPETGALEPKQKLTTQVAHHIASLPRNPLLFCLASAVRDEILIHCFNPRTNHFDLAQIIPLNGVHKVSFVSCQEGVFLAASAFQDGAWFVQVYVFSDQSLEPVQKITAFFPAAGPVIIGTTDQMGNSICLLLIAEGSFDKRLPFPTMAHRYDTATKSFVENHGLPVRGVIDVQWNVLKSGDLLTFFLTLDGVHVYIWRGHSGLQPYDFFYFPGGKSLLGIGSGNWHSLAVSGRDAACWPAGTQKDTIFKAKIKGL